MHSRWGRSCPGCSRTRSFRSRCTSRTSRERLGERFGERFTEMPREAACSGSYDNGRGLPLCGCGPSRGIGAAQVDCVAIPFFLSKKECQQIIDFAEASEFRNQHRCLWAEFSGSWG